MNIQAIEDAAIAVCQKRGYPVRQDFEYESAVNFGVALALQHPPPRGIPIEVHARMHALRQCALTRRYWSSKIRNMEQLPEDIPARPEMDGTVGIIDRHGWLVCVPYSLEELHKMAWDFGLGRDCFRSDHYHVPRSQMVRIKRHCYEVPARVTYLVAREELFG